jgi:hypothetical protein
MSMMEVDVAAVEDDVSVTHTKVEEITKKDTLREEHYSAHTSIASS